MLRDFVESVTHPDPLRTVPFASLSRAFKAQLPVAERAEWPRLRLISETVRAGYELAVDPRGQTVLVGRTLKPPKRVSVRGGRLVRA